MPLGKRAKYGDLYQRMGFASFLRQPSMVTGALIEGHEIPCAPALLEVFQRTVKFGRSDVSVRVVDQEQEQEEQEVKEETEFKEEEEPVFDQFEFEEGISMAADESSVVALSLAEVARDDDSFARDAEVTFWLPPPP